MNNLLVYLLRAAGLSQGNGSITIGHPDPMAIDLDRLGRPGWLVRVF